MRTLTVSPPRPAPGRETVVLVHGLAAGSAMLRPLERSLQRRGYQTLNWGYRSVRGEIQALSHTLAEVLRNLDSDDSVDRVHLVTHSMGSIIARSALATNQFTRLGRIVMLGPPNGGSRVAARLGRFLGWLCRPLNQLSDAPNSLVNNLPEPKDCEIGIIAASRDRVVHVDNTRLACQTDHIVVDSGHTSMLFRLEVADLVDRFLRQGRFASQELLLTAEMP